MDDEQPWERKTAEQKEKYKQDPAAFRAKGEADVTKEEAVRREIPQGGTGRGK